MPRVIGKFGHPTSNIYEPTFILTEKGGMESGGLEAFVRAQILPAYPNISREWTFDSEGDVLTGPFFLQLDAGPDRLTDCSLAFRTEMWELGLILFPGLPNGTAGNQVCDDLFGPYKCACTMLAEDIVGERLTANAIDSDVSVKLDFCDLGRIINGRVDDPIEKRAFLTAFTPEKIISSVQKLGLNPIDLKVALAHPKVRDDSNTGSRIDAVTDLRRGNCTTLAAAAKIGLNTRRRSQ